MDLSFLEGKHGLEIAGPSQPFSENGIVPIYPIIASLDDISHPRPKEWGGRDLADQGSYLYSPGRPPGRQFIGDATSVDTKLLQKYDFVAVSHVFEHIANPLKAAYQWLNILKADGVLLMIVPHRDGTFDRARPVTSLQHLLDDYAVNTQETDKTHFEEVASRSTKSFSAEWFASNDRHRGMHHHVFDTRLVVDIYCALNLQILCVEAILPYHIVIAGRKSEGKRPLNERFLESTAEYRQKSPFPSDCTLSIQT